MAHKHKTKKEPAAPKSFGWMAEYVDEAQLLVAARKLRDSGYTKTDAYTPFPVHGIDEALGIKPTILPFIVLGAGMTGTITALVLQWFTNAFDYPYIISGKPFASWPAFIPVSFELTILFSAFTTFLGMLALNGLPKFSNPVFTNPRFDRVTNDRFFLHVDSKDRYYNRDAVHKLLKETHPESLEEVLEDESPNEIPQVIWMGITTLAIFSLIPLAAIYLIRMSRSEDPRFHVFFDMDFQPKKKSQQTTTIFADGRVTRPQVAGTIARGQYAPTGSYYLGYDPEKVASADSRKSTRFVTLAQPPAETAATPEEGDPPAPAEATATQEPAPMPEPAPTETPAPTVTPETPAPDAANAQAPAAAPPAAPATGEVNLDTLPWLTEFPEGVVSEANMARGKQRFEIYCGACHGLAGDGNGLVAGRAAELAQGYWVPPTSLHDEKVRTQPIGRIFHTISNGKGKMGGYSSQINAEDRWAIALYVRALQRSRNAQIEDVPEGEKATLGNP
jgi:mono/diheme cytochrome c family protein